MVLKVYKHHAKAKLPTRGTKYSAGLDLYACLEDSICIKPGERKKIPHGLSISLQEGHEAQIRSRSGLSFKYGIIVLTTGTVDADYRGEISTLLYNISDKDFIIEPNMRISQMIVTKYESCEVQEVETHEALENFSENKRNKSGWGSTGH